jgi:hypothetical protein
MHDIELECSWLLVSLKAWTKMLHELRVVHPNKQPEIPEATLKHCTIVQKVLPGYRYPRRAFINPDAVALS